MNNYSTINVNVDFEGNRVDLRIPRLLRPDKLKEVLAKSLLAIGITPPQAFELEVVNKSLGSNQIATLSDYAVSDSDQIKVIAS